MDEPEKSRLEAAERPIGIAVAIALSIFALAVLIDQLIVSGGAG